MNKITTVTTERSQIDEFIIPGTKKHDRTKYNLLIRRPTDIPPGGVEKEDLGEICPDMYTTLGRVKAFC